MQITINNTISEISLVHQHFLDFAQKSLDDVSHARKICIVIDEVLSNIIRHGYQDDSIHQINISCKIEKGMLTLVIEDDGIAFNPLLIEQPNITSVSEIQKEGGLGIHLMKSLVDDISYQRKDRANLLSLKKYVS